MAGRDSEVRDKLAQLLVTTIEQKLALEQSGRASLQICVEVEEISAIYHKKVMAG